MTQLVKIHYDERGLVPAIVQEHGTGKVLMMAYMNEESLAITQKEGTTCFYSRSRKCLLAQGRDQRQPPACGLH